MPKSPNTRAQVSDVYRSLTAGQWLRAHATELLVALLTAGDRDLALGLLREALGLEIDQILGQLDAERARRQAERTCSPVAAGAELSCSSGQRGEPGKEHGK